MNTKKYVIGFILLMMMIGIIECLPGYINITEAASKIRVKENYINDIGKEFKIIKKKYGWTIDSKLDFDVNYGFQVVYQVPEKNIYYTFQGDLDTGEMHGNSKCISIYVPKLKDILVGYNKTLMVNNFTKRLYSENIAATHEEGWADPIFAHNEIAGEDGYYERIVFYTSKGKERVMLVDVMEPNLKKIKRNAMAEIY